MHYLSNRIRSRKQATKVHRARWTDRGSFNCLTGQWRGSVFDVDPDLVSRVTECAALNDCDAWLRYQVRKDNSEARIKVAMTIPA